MEGARLHDDHGHQHGEHDDSMNAKRKGSRNEHRSIRLLEATGYAWTRAAVSLGVFDVVGKTRDWPGKVEMAQLERFAVPPNAKKLIHRWRDGMPRPDVREVA